MSSKGKQDSDQERSSVDSSKTDDSTPDLHLAVSTRGFFMGKCDSQFRSWTSWQSPASDMFLPDPATRTGTLIGTKTRRSAKEDDMIYEAIRRSHQYLNSSASGRLQPLTLGPTILLDQDADKEAISVGISHESHGGTGNIPFTDRYGDTYFSRSGATSLPEDGEVREIIMVTESKFSPYSCESHMQS